LEKKKEMNQRRVRELLELEEMSAKRMIKEDELVGRQSGRIFCFLFLLLLNLINCIKVPQSGDRCVVNKEMI
jgi:hypothetical protein